ncbi:MAG: DNA translocase FtsK [Planctomycetaceae bacterium]|jgi:S-DNA-T family DNA segregation ATPase FtsK/SpoIIIE|nr:DNA translocase FtsK [Planctomycetaceae bacterium]
MKPLGTRFVGVVVSTLFVVFAISVLSYSPEDIPLAIALSGQGTTNPENEKIDTDNENDDNTSPNVDRTQSPTTTPNVPNNFAVNPSAADGVVAVPNPAVAQNAVNNLLSIISHNNDPNNDDDTDENINPDNTTSTNLASKNIKNLCGPIGAVLSAVSVYFFGQSAVLLMLPFCACAVKLLLVQKIDQVVLRSVGFVLALVGFCGICGLFANKLTAFPLSVKAPGGLVGTTVASVLNENVAVVGSVVLLLSLVVGGSILFADSMLLKFVKLLIVLLKNNPTSANLPHDTPPPASPPNPPQHNDKPTSTATQITNAYPVITNRDQNRPIVRHCDSDSANKNIPRDTILSQNNCPPVAQNNNRIISQANVQTGRIAPPKKVAGDYKLPPVDLLTKPEVYNENDHVEESEHQAIQIEEVFKTFNLQVEVVDVQTGPTVSQFELQLAKGLRINKIQQLADDLGLALRVPKVRVVNPISGKNTLGVELPNKHRRIVRMREMIEQSADLLAGSGIPLFLGKDVSGKPMIGDLVTLPHLLIAGRTGTGKSVCLNSIIVSILMTRTPDEVRLIMIDPKSVELSLYQNIPHLMHPVVIDMSKTEAVLAWVVDKMQERYALLKAARVVHINDYNKLSETELRRRMELENCDDEEWQFIPQRLPRLVVIIDEFGELMASIAPKEIENHITRLAQKSRAVGIHLVLATQKPTVDVITGLIKSNLPARISFGVATHRDSLVILDQVGAERLLGRGDMLFLNSDKNEIDRGQCTYVDREDIDAIVNAIKTDTPDVIEELEETGENNSGNTDIYGNIRGVAANKKQKDDEPNIDNEQRDELYEKAVEYVIGEGRGSTSLLQRKLSIGYGRAARMIETMAAEGIVGPHNGSQAREVITTLNDWYRATAKNNHNNSTKSQQKPLKQSINQNTIRHAVPIAPDPNLANNSYFDPTYNNNDNELGFAS